MGEQSHVPAETPIAMRFMPEPEHVRTARLVVIAVARRAGFDDVRLDEVRLAVGEVCARAVRRCVATGVREPVSVEIDDALDGDAVLRVRVTDTAGPQDDDPVALALVHGLADAVALTPGPGGAAGVVTLDWFSPV